MVMQMCGEVAMVMQFAKKYQRCGEVAMVMQKDGAKSSQIKVL